MATLKLHKELEKVFGPDDAPTIPSFYLKQLLRLTWSGKMASDGLRPLCWRVFLGVISNKDKSLWKTQLNQQVIDYESLKSRILPSLDKVKADPLSALSSGEGQSEEWSQYYKNVELSNFIKGDLDRLYLTGIEEENYFQTKDRRNMLLSILFLWSLQNPCTSYRQGMHEIVGCILFVIETERLAWEKAVSKKEMSTSHSMVGVFSETTIEAHTYYLFERIMEELQPLYDPVATKSHGVESQPFVVQFCTKIQEHYLRILDPDLCALLEDSYVQAQLYGLRWSRLMLGREFAVTSHQLFVVWDYIFACCFDAEQTSAAEDEDIPTNVYSMLANARLLGNRKDMNSALQRKSSEKPSYVCTPLLGALGDFMLAMLLHIRAELIDSDANSVMCALMHYPEQENVQPIVEFTDMIRRGVIIQESNLFVNVNPNFLNSGASEKTSPTPPSWLLKSSASSSFKTLTAPSTLNGVGKKITDKFSAVKSAVGSGLTDLVQTLSDYSESQHSAHSATDLSAATAAVSFAQEPSSRASKQPVQQPVGDFDPLMGSVFTGGVASSRNSVTVTVANPLRTASSPASSPVAKSKPVEQPAPAPPPPTGLGTGYANMEGVAPAASVSSKGKGLSSGLGALNEDGDSSFVVSSTPVTPARSGSMTMFTPTSWFPASSSSAVGAASKRDKRSSGGVDLHMLQTSQKGGVGSAGPDGDLSSVRELKGGNSAAKSSALANNNGVGDRLLDIADLLVHPSYKALSPALQEGRELEFEAELRRETVRRLRALADVLAGLSSFVEYDTKFTNHAATAPSSSATVLSTLTHPTNNKVVTTTTSSATSSPLTPIKSSTSNSISNTVINSAAATNSKVAFSTSSTASVPTISPFRDDDDDGFAMSVLSESLPDTATTEEEEDKQEVHTPQSAFDAKEEEEDRESFSTSAEELEKKGEEEEVLLDDLSTTVTSAPVEEVEVEGEEISGDGVST